jgi:hypothetical protein
MARRSARTELAGFLAKYTPEVAARARSVLARVRKQLPGAVELVYDNYNGLAIGFGPTDRPADLILSVTVYPRWVSLFFVHGAQLPDPTKVLKGSGSRIRHIVLAQAADVDAPPVRALIQHAAARAATPGAGRGRIVIQSVSPRQRPRRPSS